MHEVLGNPNPQLERNKDSEHLILTLVKKENLNVFSPASNRQVSPGQLFMADCRISTPQQVQDWYVLKPTGTPFLLLSPEEEHLAKMASVSIMTPKEAVYAMLYEPTTSGKVCITVLGYVPLSENVRTNAKVIPKADSFPTDYFMKAVRRIFEGPLTLDTVTPTDPPEGLICECPGNPVRQAVSYTPGTSREPFDDGFAFNKSATSLVVVYTPYLFLQQLEGTSDSSQIIIIETAWQIYGGDLYANDKYDRGNAQTNLVATLEPDTSSPFYALGFSPETSTDNGSFDANVDEKIYYYDAKSETNESYEFLASNPYQNTDWAVEAHRSDTAIGPNFYATQPGNCKAGPNIDAWEHNSKVRELPPGCCSDGQLTFYTYSSWKTPTNKLVDGYLTIFTNWSAYYGRWYTDKGFWGYHYYNYWTSFGFSLPYQLNLTNVYRAPPQ
jgi:hypothetical protein